MGEVIPARPVGSRTEGMPGPACGGLGCCGGIDCCAAAATATISEKANNRIMATRAPQESQNQNRLFIMPGPEHSTHGMCAQR
jgi:hypothetical protein